MLFKNTITIISFSKWFKEENRRLLWLTGIVIVTQFVIFKFMYPYPNFMKPDSFYYLGAAYNNQFINIWPIGYSKFLRLFSSFTKSHVALVWVQYLLMQSSLLYFLFTIRYLLNVNKWSFRVLMICCLLNPLISHISNFVSSDALFTALSLVWFTQLLWIIYKPGRNLLILHGVILLLTFMVRYNALYYPFISIIIISFSHLPKKLKGMAIGFVLLLLCIFIGQTRNEYQKETATTQFSAFGGWQLAANALYGYAHAIPDSLSTVPYKFRELHKVVNAHMNFLSRMPPFLRPDHNVDVYYLWDPQSPLKVYMANQFRNDSASSYFKQWASMAPMYSAYGRYLIERHPGTFLKHYVWPNLVKYYSPPTGFLGYYNKGEDTLDKITEIWFGWENNSISNYFKDKKLVITEAFPIVVAIINLMFALNFLAFVSLGGFKRCVLHRRRILWCMVIVWLSNMIFSVLAAPIELRYQLFQIVITFVFFWFLLTYIIQASKTSQIESGVQHGNPNSKRAADEIFRT